MFPIVRQRARVTTWPGGRAADPAVVFKLVKAAQDRWRAVNAPHRVALVRAGVTFINDHLVGQAAA